MVIDWFPLWLSLRVAALSTALSLAAGLWIAYLLANRSFRGKEILDAAVTLPLVLPPTVLGYYLLVLLGRESPIGKLHEAVFGAPLVFTWQAAVIAAFFSFRTSADKVRPSGARKRGTVVYERAARSLGVPEWRVFWAVTLPLARRSVLAATVLAFARALGDFGVTIMIAGNIPGRTQNRRRRDL